MKAKRGFTLILLGFLLIASLNLISAQYYSSLNLEQTTRDLIEQTTQFLRPVFEVLVGDYSGSSTLLVKSLVLIMLFILINGVIKKTKLGETNMIAGIIAICVSILSVRFMPENYVTALLLPYTALGIALTTIIPFMVVFYFAYATQMGGVGRRLIWGLYAIVFITLFFTRRTELSDIGQKIYIAVMVLMVLVFIFDRGIKRYFFSHEMGLFYKDSKNKAIAHLQAEYLNIISVDSPVAKERRREIEDNLRRIGGSLP